MKDILRIENTLIQPELFFKTISSNQRSEAAGLTFGAETSRDVRFGRSDVRQTQSAFIEVLIGEEVS